MYPELEKYKTGVNHSPSTIDNIKYYEYQAPLGDLLNDYLKHKNKPFWLRKYYHKHLTEIYVKMLNQINVTRFF